MTLKVIFLSHFLILHPLCMEPKSFVSPRLDMKAQFHTSPVQKTVEKCYLLCYLTLTVTWLVLTG